MAERAWTAGQKNCIDARGGTVIVSAAAGSGKTAVLIERIVSLLCDETNPLSIDNLLVVTFTKAAAAEMRSRLHKRLADKLALDPHNRHLQQQQLLLPQASISTVHSFCSKLLREFSVNAGISPRFKVAQDTSLDLLRNDIVNRLIDDAYTQKRPAFLKLCDQLNDDRRDTNLAGYVLSIYDFIQAHPFPLQWLDRQLARFREDVPLKDTVWGQIILSQIRDDLNSAVATLSKVMEEIDGDDKLMPSYGPSVSISLSDTIAAVAALDEGWDAAKKAIGAIRFEKLKGVRGYEDTAFKNYVQSLRSYAQELIVKHAAPAITLTEAEAVRTVKEAEPIIAELFAMIRRFDEEFSKAKHERNMLDFSDLEHFTLSLIAAPDDNGGFTRTAIGREIGARFTHIMVDEYQDTNATQDTLFSALSNDEKNLFFVGDIKQSIYGFRHARPSIFRDRRDSCFAYDGEHYPAAVILGNNFRSRKQVTESVNFLFRKLMTKDTGGIVYDEREELVASARFDNEDAPAYNTELLLLPTKELEEDLKTYEAEARLIGEKIRELIDRRLPVSGKDGVHAVTYRDCLILLRSVKSTASIYVKELQEMGIPVSTKTETGLFECAEIKTAVSILRAIDNPMIDVPLLGAMMSPVFGFSPDDIARIRQNDSKSSIYNAVRLTSRQPSSLGQKCRRFLDTLNSYRTLSVSLPADKLIRRIFDDTAMLSVMSAKSGGSARVANLHKLYDLARRFEDEDARGLSAFVRYIDQLEEQRIRVDAASAVTQNAVQIMTIHGSKGLEAPVVFVGALSKSFSNKSKSGTVLLHAEHGIGIPVKDREAFKTYESIHHSALAKAISREDHTEELRLLYVAMTRAKDKLILVSTVQNLEKRINDLRPIQPENGVLPSSFILHTSSASNWVLAACLHHPAGKHLLHYQAGDTPSPVSADGMTVCVADLSHQHDEDHREDVTGHALSLDHLSERLHYRYPYASLGQIAAKLTASKAAHGAQTADTLFRLSRPAFLSKGGLTPAQRGTATHLFLEHMRFDGTPAAKQAEELVAENIITDEQANALDMNALDRFLQGTLAARMAKSDKLYRELAFAFERTVEQLGLYKDDTPSDALNDTVMVQGIADAVLVENNEAVIVDYKTDRVTAVSELSERYRAQLAIYKDAVERTLHIPVKTCVIYSFHLHRDVEVEI